VGDDDEGSDISNDIAEFRPVPLPRTRLHPNCTRTPESPISDGDISSGDKSDAGVSDPSDVYHADDGGSGPPDSVEHISDGDEHSVSLENS
jgi:hypothetical protein